MKITVCRKAHFNSAHRLANLSWTKEKNLKVFGKCSYDNYHGHNYELIVKLTGEIDPETGMLMDLSILKKIIKTEVEDVLDHKNLNLDIPHFKNLIPSTENLAVFILIIEFSIIFKLSVLFVFEFSKDLSNRSNFSSLNFLLIDM